MTCKFQFLTKRLGLHLQWTSGNDATEVSARCDALSAEDASQGTVRAAHRDLDAIMASDAAKCSYKQKYGQAINAATQKIARNRNFKFGGTIDRLFKSASWGWDFESVRYKAIPVAKPSEAIRVA